MNKKKIKSILIFIVALSLGGLIGYLIGNIDALQNMFPEKGEMGPIVFVYLIFAGLFVITFHELGHLLIGLAQGFEFYLFTVGFLEVKRNEEGKIQWELNTDFSKFGGLAATMPKEFDETTMDKFANLIIAGPIASLLLALVCFFIGTLVGQPFAFILLATGMISVAIFLATTLPSKTGHFYTDRKRYQRLKNGGKESKIELAMMQANVLKMTGKSLKEMNESDLELITTDNNSFFQYCGYYYLCEYHKDDLEKMNGFIEKMKAMENDIPKGVAEYFMKDIEEMKSTSH